MTDNKVAEDEKPSGSDRAKLAKAATMYLPLIASIAGQEVDFDDDNDDGEETSGACGKFTSCLTACLPKSLADKLTGAPKTNGSAYSQLEEQGNISAESTTASSMLGDDSMALTSMDSLEYARMRSGTADDLDADDGIERSTTTALFLFKEAEDAPPIGGLELTDPHSDFLLPLEVVLFEPSDAEIGIPYEHGQKGKRLIFLNTELSKAEQTGLQALHDALMEETKITAENDCEFPNYVRLHALRILQQAKFDVKKALPIILTHLTMRVERFKRCPLRDTDIELREDLHKGLMYWHGRDRKCRPCLVWKLERMSGFTTKRAVNLVLFVLEYGVRYALIPGRVENWNLIVDLENVGTGACSSSNMKTAKSIGKLLEEVYCGRNFQTKILRLPWVIRSVVNSFIPSDKKEKVQFVSDKELPKVMGQLMEPHQLEQRYGGTADNVAADQSYPFRFFRNATGKDQEQEGDQSLHTLTNRQFHEGFLCDESSTTAKSTWMAGVQEQSLTPTAAKYFTSIGANNAKACTDLQTWLETVNPKEAQRRKKQ